MCVKKNTRVVLTSRNKMSTTWDLYCGLVPQWEALCICFSAFPITTKWCFDQDMKVVPGRTFTKRTCNRCGSLQKREDVVATSRLALHWMCGFHMPNTWKWPEMKMYLNLNLATFQCIDGFGCHHFCLKQIWIGIDHFHLKFFATFGSVLGLQITVGLQVNTGLATDTLWAIYCRHNAASPWTNQRKSLTDNPQNISNGGYTFDQVHFSVATANSTLYVAKSCHLMGVG